MRCARVPMPLSVTNLGTFEPVQAHFFDSAENLYIEVCRLHRT